jgi:hypothetical protein
VKTKKKQKTTIQLQQQSMQIEGMQQTFACPTLAATMPAEICGLTPITPTKFLE